MNTIDILRKKREKQKLTVEEINFIVSEYAKDVIPDYQFAAFLMAVYLNNFDEEETAALTKAMLYSGKVLDLSSIKGVKVDKHSTGGIGDKTSLIIAPVAAAAGVIVPMISGRGLGHTGGTLDKLEAIPGFKTDISLADYKKILKKAGAVLIGQTKDIAPADKKIYALRDVTATVESLPLITGSIMSKKLAEGIDGLVLDVKCGSGAFMKTPADAAKLAASLMNTAKAFDKNVMAFITDMNEPLGHYIGNWFEVLESIEILKGNITSGNLFELCLQLAGAMIYLGGKANNLEEGIAITKKHLADGSAYTVFKKVVELQGGDSSYLDNPEKYPKSKFSMDITAPKSGYFKCENTAEIGMASLELGAGRFKKEDIIDPKAGIIFYPRTGDKIKKGEVIAVLYADSAKKIEAAKARLLKAVSISAVPVQKNKLIKKILK